MIASEGDVLADILLAHSRGNARLFRFNAGTAWQGKIVEQTPQRLVMLYPRAIKLACEGFSDIAGWVQEDGRAIFTAIEGKYGKRKATPEQKNFIEVVKQHGGRAGVAYNIDDAAAIMYGPRSR